MSRTLATRTLPRTQLRQPLVRDHDRQRAALSFDLTLRLAGKSGKQAATIIDTHKSTVSRWTDGEHDSRVSRFRELLRALARAGVSPVPVLVDCVADLWSETAKGWSPDEIRARIRDLHTEEERANHRVNLWQMTDLSNATPECERAVDEALLEQASRTVQIFALRQELRLRRIA